MQWQFEKMSLEEIIEYLTNPPQDMDGNIYNTIRCRQRGRQLWTVIETIDTSGNKSNEIVLFHLKKLGNEWGWKMYKESTGINSFSCPITFLKISKSYDEVWRHKVISTRHKKAENY